MIVVGPGFRGYIYGTGGGQLRGHIETRLTDLKLLYGAGRNISCRRAHGFVGNIRAVHLDAGGPTEAAAKRNRGKSILSHQNSVMDLHSRLELRKVEKIASIHGKIFNLVHVEHALHKVCGDDPCVVLGIPDEKKGEKLVALYTAPNIEPDAVWKALADSDMPRLWLPKRENIYRVPQLPTLGTGKLDLRGVKTLAQNLAGSAEVA